MLKLHRRYLLPIYLPVMAICIGIVTSQLRSQSSQEPFRLELVELIAKPSHRPKADTEVILTLRAHGPWEEKVANLIAAPNQQPPQWGIADDCEIFYRNNGRLKPYRWPQDTPPIITHVSSYDAKFGGFIRHYSLDLTSVLRDLGPLYCRVKFKFFIDTRKSWSSKDWKTKADASAEGLVRVRA